MYEISLSFIDTLTYFNDEACHVEAHLIELIMIFTVLFIVK